MIDDSKEKRKAHENYITTLKARAKEHLINTDNYGTTDPSKEEKLQNDILAIQDEVKIKCNTISNLESDLEDSKIELDVILQENAKLKTLRENEIQTLTATNDKLKAENIKLKKELSKTKKMLTAALNLNSVE